MSGSAFVAPLALEIDSRPALDAVSALDRLSEASGRTEGRVGAIRTATDALVAALTKNATATAALTSALAQVDAAGGRAGRSISEVGASAATATTNVVRFDRSLIDTRTDLNNVATSARDATAAWAALGAMGAATAQRLDVARRMAAASALATPGAAANQNGRLRADQIQNLMYQGGDILASAGSGASLGLIALQQGPQIAQVFGGPGGASVRGAISQASEAAGGLVARIGIVGGAIGGLTATLIAAVAAQQSFSSTQSALAQQLSGVGRASGVTAGQINALAPAAAAAGSVSVRSAREMAGEFAATGRIGSEMYASIIGTVKNFAATTGQEVPEATKVLAAAFADPGKGAEALNRQLGFLDAATRENIQTLAAQGDRLGAQRALFEAYKNGLTNATELTSAWGRVTGSVGRIVSDAWDKAGQAVDRFLTGGDLEARIADLRRVLAEGPQQQTGILGFLGVGAQRGVVQGELDRLVTEQQRRQAQSRQADLAQRSTAVDDLVKQYNPAQERLKEIERAATRIRSELAAGVLDPSGESRRTAEGLEAAAKRIREDMAQGGTQFASAIREAQFGLRTVGFTPQGQRAASISERTENEILALQTDPNDPLLRDFQIASIRERARIELETARREATLSENATGGVFSRLSPEVQQQFLTAAQNPRYARIPVGVAAAITGPESGGNLDVGFSRSLGEDGRRSSAYGLGQITAGTAADAARRGYLPPGYDRTNRSTMAEGILGVLSMKLDDNGGDLTRAIMAYRGSADPSVNRAYAAKVMRDAGQMGDASALGQVRDQDANARALKTANDNVRILTESYGRNGAALEAQTRSTEQYNSLLARGVSATDAASIAFGGLNDKLVSVERAGRLVQAFRDDDFARDQLGRDRYDQQAYAIARSRFGDTTSPEATALIGRSRETAFLSDLRTSFTDAGSSFVSAMMRGANAASAFGDVLSRFADKAVNSLMDTAFSAIFSAGSKGGGSDFLGGIAKVFGFSDGGYTGAGGRLQPAGIVHREEVVWSQADVARWGGPSVVDAMRRGLRGYSEGGLVGWSPGPAANGNASQATDARTFSFDMRGSTLTEQQARAMFMDALSQSEARQSAALPGRMRDIQRRAA